MRLWRLGSQLLLVQCMGIAGSRSASSVPVTVMAAAEGREVATIAVYNRMRGVHEAISGYTGGREPNPSYEAVCGGDTGHAEAVRVVFDPATISYERILDIFFTIHDPTQLNRQGNDVGTQYRSAIYTHGPEQEAAARRVIDRIKGEFKGPIVTEVTPAGVFYPAEEYHQRYYDKNPDAGYCRAVVRHKVVKAEKVFADQLK